MIVSIVDGEEILGRENREISILVATEAVTITRARYSVGEQVAGPHVHHQHTDAFYVLEGELTFEIGCEGKTITVSSGGFVAVPPEVSHSLRNDSDRPARWLTIHAPDGGFAAFMRGIRDGVEVEWDISAVPADGGLPQAKRSSDRETPEPSAQRRRPWAARVCSRATTSGVASCISVRQALGVVPEARLDSTEHGLVPTGEGWFVLNARKARWYHAEGRPAFCDLEGDQNFPQLGINVQVLLPGDAMAMYHWEADQEDFLVLSGEAHLIVEGEERPLRAWDFVHCPAETKHTIVGAGDGPCVVVAVGTRAHADSPDWGGYTVDEVALRHTAGVEKETNEPREAYAHVTKREHARYRDGWLPG